MAKPKIKPHLKTSFIKEQINKRTSILDEDPHGFFLISFKHLDKNQGQLFIEWEANMMLSEAMETLSNFCQSPLTSQQSSSFTIYGEFPPNEKTDFTHPRHVPEDAQWARIHVNGLYCIIGHVLQNVFYVVFLDGTHSFWKSTLKHT